MTGIYRVGWDEYRDERKFVMNLEPCGGGQWLLTTYRNTGALPPVRQDKFKTKDEAIAYVKKWEPTVPILTLQERPLELNLDGLKSDEQVHADYEVWLEARGLFGALSLKRHQPFFWDTRGWTEKKRVVENKILKQRIDGTEIEVSETKDFLKES